MLTFHHWKKQKVFKKLFNNSVVLLVHYSKVKIIFHFKHIFDMYLQIILHFPDSTITFNREKCNINDIINTASSQ